MELVNSGSHALCNLDIINFNILQADADLADLNKLIKEDERTILVSTFFTEKSRAVFQQTAGTSCVQNEITQRKSETTQKQNVQ